ncbi:MAG: acyltransferase [Mariniphaga sp.]|nr:acyltransferase [Mariniphaga sp.]
MKRYSLPDLLKGFAVFLIVPVHILELFIDYPGRESLFGKTLLFLGGPVAVPIFMIVMGYFIAKSKKSFIKNILRGVKIFAIGLLLNIGLNFNLLLKIKYAGWQFNPLEYIFGVDILYLAGLSVIFIALLKVLKKGQAWVALIFIFLVLGLTGFMNEILMVTERNYILPFIAGTYSWAYFPLFPWLAYPLIGFVFFHWEEKIMLFFTKQKIVSGIILAGIGVLVISFYKWGISTTINLPAYYHHTFWFSFWVIGIVVLWVVLLRFLLKKIPNTYIGDFLRWLGKNITLFYVIQWLIIGNIATTLYQTQSINSYWYWFGGIFMVTVLLTWLLEKTNVKIAR